MLHDVLKRYGSWHKFIGAPKFPTYWLFNQDTNFDDVKSIEITINDHGKLTKIVGKNASQDEASLELTWDNENKIAKGTLKNGETTELTIEEWIDENVLYVDTKYPANSNYDVQVRVTKPEEETTEYPVEVDINKKTLNGVVDINSETSPQILSDIVAELDSMQSTAKVAAMNPRMAAYLNFEAWKNGSYGSLEWQELLDGIGTILSDVLNPFLSAGYYAVSYVLSNWNKFF